MTPQNGYMRANTSALMHRRFEAIFGRRKWKWLSECVCVCCAGELSHRAHFAPFAIDLVGRPLTGSPVADRQIEFARDSDNVDGNDGRDVSQRQPCSPIACIRCESAPACMCVSVSVSLCPQTYSISIRIRSDIRFGK